MNAHVRAVAWKEWIALSDQLSIRGAAGGLALLVFGGVMGVFFPWVAGPDLLASPVTLFLYPFIGVSAAATPILDSIAGERERRTLETLLATPLSDRAILFGKISVGLVMGLAVPYTLYGVAIVVTNVKVWGTGIALPPAWLMIGVVAGVPAAVGLVCTAGSLGSMRAATVRQTAQWFGYVIFAVFLTPVLVTLLLPEGIREQGRAWIATQQPMTLVIAGCAGLIVTDLAFLILAIKGFRRGRLPL